MLLLQAAFARAKKIYSPQSTGAVLCGQGQMTEVCHCFVCLKYLRLIILVVLLANYLVIRFNDSR